MAEPLRTWERVRAVVDGALEVVFPRVCLECGGLVGEGLYRHMCGACAEKIVWVGAPHCSTCGHPFFGELAGERDCAHCAGLRPAFREGRAATLMQGPMRRLVHGLKYEGALHLLEDVERLVRRHGYFCEFLAGARLVPVPLHPLKRRERGYNQSELLAECFAKVASGSVEPLLERVIYTPSQTRLDRRERRENLKNAFALAKRVQLIPNARHVLVDDVFTTGATVNACALALRRVGLSTLDVATLGHG